MSDLTLSIMASFKRADWLKENMDYAINHVFMPPKLPQRRDANLKDNDIALLSFVAETAKSYGTY